MYNFKVELIARKSSTWDVRRMKSSLSLNTGGLVISISTQKYNDITE